MITPTVGSISGWSWMIIPPSAYVAGYGSGEENTRDEAIAAASSYVEEAAVAELADGIKITYVGRHALPESARKGLARNAVLTN